jgi:hypothetical protein
MTNPILIVGQVYSISGEHGRRFELLRCDRPKGCRSRLVAHFRDVRVGSWWTFLVAGRPYTSGSGLKIHPRRVRRARITPKRINQKQRPTQ